MRLKQKKEKQGEREKLFGQVQKRKGKKEKRARPLPYKKPSNHGEEKKPDEKGGNLNSPITLRGGE